MSDNSIGQTPTVFSSKERAALVAKALSEAARRARFSTKRRRSMTSGGLRARRGDAIFRRVRNWSFVFGVAIPLMVYGVYIFLIASSQYAAEARFTVLGGLPTSMDSIGAMTGIPSMMIAQDTQVIVNYIQSRAIVETLDKSIGLKSFFQKSDIDHFSRLSPKLPIEKVLRYWLAQLDIKMQMPSGIVTFSVRAFTPDDSVKITSAALDASEELVNRMNDQMRKDAVFVAETERQRAEARVAQTRADLEHARNQEGMLSAESTAEGFDKLVDQVKGQLMTMEQNYDSQRRFVSDDAPQLRDLQTKIDAAKGQIAKLEAQITASPSANANADADVDSDGPGGARVLSGSMSRLDYAKLENDIAEKIYALSLAGLEEARLASEVKVMYVNRFIEPVAPQESKYPKRGLDFVILCLVCFTLWGVVVGSTKFALNKML